ncbi:MAG: EthD domain-containing protein [Hyphomonadaceae bacterium]|nr:EthD domain-containing protein [Hyphomonadaceae bacterium]
MIKLTFCLVRLPHLSREDFQRYWRETHGPLVASVREPLRIRRYVQLHSADPAVSADLRATRQSPDQFDGVAQLWWDSAADLAATASDPAAREAGRRLLEDERRFIDLPRSPLWLGEEHVVIG